MKISDFIKKLREFNQDADITLETSENITLSYVCRSPKGEHLTKQTTKQVFIEPIDNCRVCSFEYMEGDTMWCSFYDKPCGDVYLCDEFEEFVDP